MDDEIGLVEKKLDQDQIHEQICKNVLDGIIDIIELVDESVTQVENNDLFISIEKNTSINTKRHSSVTSEEFRAVISELDENLCENGKYTNIVQVCVHHLKQLMHNYVHNVIFDNTVVSNDDIASYFTNLFHSNSIVRRPSGVAVDNGFEINDIWIKKADLKLKIKEDAFEYLSSFKQLNKFLIKLFLFPLACANHEQINLIYTSNDSNQNYFQFEDWIKDLFVISCFSQNAEHENFFEFQSITINTLFEFFFISESVYSNLSNFDNKYLGTIVFTHKQLNLIYNESHIGQIIGQKLWSYLSHSPNNPHIDTFKYHKRAATLFCLLHELLPNNLCENIISKCLNGNETMQLDTIRRFIHLWHWSKELQNNTTQPSQEIRKIVKTFERCVFMLIDLIDKSTSPVNKLIQEWLNKSINDGDLCRILDILIISLLNPNTSRISIQFYNLLSSNNQSNASRKNRKNSNNSNEDSQYENKVYAISNEKGKY